MLSNLIKALGWSIFHSLWQGALIYALLFVILMAIPKLNAKLKHNLAFGSMLLMFGSFCFTFYSTFEVPLTNTQQATVNAFIAQASLQDLSLLKSSNFLNTESWFPLVTSAYAIGIAIQLLLLFSGYQKLKQLKKANTITVSEEWNKIFQTILGQLNINKEVKFFLSARVNVPLVIGYFKPVVLFPIALATQLEIKQVEAILIHELSHIRRNDYALNLIKTFIETLLFFNPFIWLAGKFIRIEREHACDDLVVKYTGTPLTYAHALLKLELLKDKQAPILSLAATGTNQHLYQRIKRITNMKTTYINAKQQLVIFALTLSTVLSLAWMNPKKPAIKKAKSLSTIDKIATENKSINNHLVLKADTDTTKKKKRVVKSTITITDDNGNTKIYNSIKDLPDSLRSIVIRNKFIGDSLSAFYSSKEWKDKMAKIQLNAEDMRKRFESKEWKDQMAKIQLNAEEMRKKFDSKEWKDQVAKMQFNAEEMKKKFESKEWKDHIAKMQLNAEEMRKKFESKEWKDHIAKMQFNAEEMKKKFESKEWKDQMAKIQFNAEELKKKFDSPEWKQKIEELKKLQETPEYKELKKKFDNDLNELKKQKGIKNDITFN
ncbi:Signal transducer regulating beta-lactamase production, contains metallopeptidase domain [Pedobacter insulae]|uniref:Signal transducer regulating beta-lactamase production, contains metallopeptidase domain n=2 Tax=Pedobacter insulae TaxID=414048 RepID=A0A1I2XTH3_9SPHI|nr:Signal transducer regulating beta-lactamase production, contains metallopeptidase domain [Pedobacter insulae]